MINYGNLPIAPCSIRDRRAWFYEKFSNDEFELNRIKVRVGEQVEEMVNAIFNDDMVREMRANPAQVYEVVRTAPTVNDQFELLILMDSFFNSIAGDYASSLIKAKADIAARISRETCKWWQHSIIFWFFVIVFAPLSVMIFLTDMVLRLLILVRGALKSCLESSCSFLNGVVCCGACCQCQCSPKSRPVAPKAKVGSICCWGRCCMRKEVVVTRQAIYVDTLRTELFRFSLMTKLVEDLRAVSDYDQYNMKNFLAVADDLEIEMFTAYYSYLKETFKNDRFRPADDRGGSLTGGERLLAYNTAQVVKEMIIEVGPLVQFSILSDTKHIGFEPTKLMFATRPTSIVLESLVEKTFQCLLASNTTLTLGAPKYIYDLLENLGLSAAFVDIKNIVKSIDRAFEKIDTSYDGDKWRVPDDLVRVCAYVQAESLFILYLGLWSKFLRQENRCRVEFDAKVKSISLKPSISPYHMDIKMIIEFNDQIEILGTTCYPRIEIQILSLGQLFMINNSNSHRLYEQRRLDDEIKTIVRDRGVVVAKELIENRRGQEIERLNEKYDKMIAAADDPADDDYADGSGRFRKLVHEARKRITSETPLTLALKEILSGPPWHDSGRTAFEFV